MCTNMAALHVKLIIVDWPVKVFLRFNTKSYVILERKPLCRLATLMIIAKPLSLLKKDIINSKDKKNIKQYAQEIRPYTLYFKYCLADIVVKSLCRRKLCIYF